MFLKETAPGTAFVGCPEDYFFLSIRKEQLMWFKEKKTKSGVGRTGCFCAEGFGRDGIRLGSELRFKRYRDLKVRVSKPSKEILIFDVAFRIRDQ